MTNAMPVQQKMKTDPPHQTAEQQEHAAARIMKPCLAETTIPLAHFI